MMRSFIRVLVAATILAASTAPRLRSQVVEPPRAAFQLVVRIVAHFDSTATTIGSGVIVGRRPDGTLVIATAGHVVRRAKARDIPIWVQAHGRRDSVTATVNTIDNDADFAIILARPAGNLGGLEWDRMGRPTKLTRDDEIAAVGCPDYQCWVNPTPDNFIGLRGRSIYFQSFVLSPGNSGGGIFNEQWELVGVVTDKQNLQGRGIVIDSVVRRVRGAGLPVDLHRARIPRAGYRFYVSGEYLAGVGGGTSAPTDGRLPSGHLTATRHTRSGLSYHVGGLRLAQANLNVNALLGGGAYVLRRGPLGLLPFVEVGFGRVEGRFDSGGYFVTDPGTSSGSRYVPRWNQVGEAGLGIGGGLRLQYLVAPHLALQATAAHWAFGIPTALPSEKLPTVHFGIGFGVGF